MWENCVLLPTQYSDIQRRYNSDDPCKHCTYHKYGCPNTEPFLVSGKKYIPTEKSSNDLPKCDIWCKTCRKNSGRIFHKTYWNRLSSFAIRCSICGEEFFMYEYKVYEKYLIPEKSSDTLVYSSSIGKDSPTAMELAMKKAGLL